MILVRTKLLVENQGASQVVMGLDDPYPLGEMESDQQSSYPGKILDLAIDRNIITQKKESDAMGVTMSCNGCLVITKQLKQI